MDWSALFLSEYEISCLFSNWLWTWFDAFHTFTHHFSPRDAISTFTLLAPRKKHVAHGTGLQLQASTSSKGRRGSISIVSGTRLVCRSRFCDRNQGWVSEINCQTYLWPLILPTVRSMAPKRLPLEIRRIQAPKSSMW